MINGLGLSMRESSYSAGNQGGEGKTGVSSKFYHLWQLGYICLRSTLVNPGHVFGEPVLHSSQQLTLTSSLAPLFFKSLIISVPVAAALV